MRNPDQPRLAGKARKNCFGTSIPGDCIAPDFMDRTCLLRGGPISEMC